MVALYAAPVYSTFTLSRRFRVRSSRYLANSGYYAEMRTKKLKGRRVFVYAGAAYISSRPGGQEQKGKDNGQNARFLRFHTPKLGGEGERGGKKRKNVAKCFWLFH